MDKNPYLEKNDNILQSKTYQFAIRCVKLYKYLQEQKRELVLSKQVLRSGTSIGANVEEAIGAQSDKDFYSKITYAYKEARETHYWLRLLRDTEYLSLEESKSLLNDVEEIIKIITKIQITLKKKIESKT
jgi:four helix bundle protein